MMLRVRLLVIAKWSVLFVCVLLLLRFVSVVVQCEFYVICCLSCDVAIAHWRGYVLLSYLLLRDVFVM